MYQSAEQYLSKLQSLAKSEVLCKNLIGLEKESLRVNTDGHIAQTPHPLALGSALTNPYITTDYSEALCEFITRPQYSATIALQHLQQTQQFVYAQLSDEILWATSMPCVLAGETSIPIADYGPSNAGVMKTVYRRGLGLRYGRVMQVIAGVHFNFSFNTQLWPLLKDLEKNNDDLSTFITTKYFALIRNLQRFGWLIPYLFGASPAVCKSFLKGQSTDLATFDSDTYYGPYATSLRMADIGYQNQKEGKAGVRVCYNSLEEYVQGLTQAIQTPYPDYEKIGVKKQGQYQQLNANILQIENEYYSATRPKQTPQGNEKPILSLLRRGVEYVELRSLDINAFEPQGINAQTLHFLETFFLFCLCQHSPPIAYEDRKEIKANLNATAYRGRAPDFSLTRHQKPILLQHWAKELNQVLQGFAELLDSAQATTQYTDAVQHQAHVIADPNATPSAKVLEEMRANHESFYYFSLRKSQQHKRYFDKLAPDPDRHQFFSTAAQQSLEKQQAIENNDTLSFDEYLQRYFDQTL